MEPQGTVTSNGEDAYIEGTLEVDGAVRFDGTLTSSAIVPNTSDTYDVGSDTVRYNDLFLKTGAVHLGTSSADEAYLLYQTASNSLVINSAFGASSIVNQTDTFTTSKTQLALTII